MLKKSEEMMVTAKRYIPGGVNSPVRSFKSVGGTPPFIERGKGSRIYDIDGNEYIDYVASWGPLILGHAHPEVISAIKEVSEKGTSFGAPTALEVDMARLVCNAFPSIDLVRFVNSGTEAVMSAIRLARGFTKRNKIIKCDGCYHGHSDNLLIQAGSGAATLGVPDSAGVPRDFVKNTISLPYNNLEAFKGVLDKEKDIACLIVEPIAGNMGVIPPEKGFLEGLRKLTEEHGILLIFDEVITGFRVSSGGAQKLYGVTPDLTCLGKIVGGGLPVGAYGGKEEIMKEISPLGPVYQAGTLSGNPLAITAGLTTLKILLRDEKAYQELDEKAETLCRGMEENAEKAGVPAFLTRVGSMFCMFFTGERVVDYETARKSDTEKFSRYFHAMLKQGINIASSQFEAGFISTAHSYDDIEKTLSVQLKALKSL
jgi:glutamate-1-semialdehyde 2,1-aminomutase